MSEGETALSNAMNDMGVNSASAFNMPASGTPTPAHILSGETVSLIDSVAEKLLKEKKSADPTREKVLAPFHLTERAPADKDTLLQQRCTILKLRS